MGMEKASVARRIPADVAVVLFGMDRAKKAHASRFGSATAQSAQAAARSMGMRAIRITTDEQRAVAAKLPRGSVSPTGKAVVPFVKPALYQKLLAVAGPDAPPAPLPKSPTLPADGVKPGAPGSDAKPGAPDDTLRLAKGAVVLATDDPATGWWPAAVQFVDGELLTLRWQPAEWKDLPSFIRRLSQVATMPKGKPC